MLSATTGCALHPCRSNCGITRGLVLSSEPGSNPGLASREGLYIGIGQAMMPRSEIFRVSSGVAVQMEQRPFMVPSWNGGGHVLLLLLLPLHACAADAALLV